MESATEKQIALLEKNGIDASGFTKQQASTEIEAMIAKNTGGSPKADKPKSSNPVGNAMYVSYAKDLFIALYNKEESISPMVRMEEAIGLVKKAIEGFN